MSKTNLIIDRIFKFYEGPDPELYTPLTGINLNKTPRILAEAIDDLYSKIGKVPTSKVPLTDRTDLDDSDTAASAKSVKSLKDLLDNLQDTKNELSDALDQDDSGISASSRAAYLLNQKIESLRLDIDGLSSSGSSINLSDNPDEDSSDNAASTKATKILADRIKGIIDTKNILSDSLELDDSGTSASSKAIYDLKGLLDSSITEIKGSLSYTLDTSTESALGEIPNEPKIPVTYLGDEGSLYLGKPREWIEITTESGKGLIPVFTPGVVVDNR